MVDRRDEEVSRHSNSNHNDNDDDKSNEDKGWIPRHKDNPVIDPAKIYSVSEAARLHKGKNITVRGASDLHSDTHVQNMDVCEDQKNCTDRSHQVSDRSDKSDRIPRYISGGNGNGRLLS